MYIDEKRRTEIVDDYDVAVCGGGFAGISAAIAAARCGKKTVLFEKEYVLGGLGTAGIITIYLPLCDGMGHQVSFGIAEELLKLSIKHGSEAEYPANWLDGVGERNENSPRYRVQYNPHLFSILAEKLLVKEGVSIMYGTYVVSTEVKDSKITHLVTENKSGRQAYKVCSVVDATGDCDIALFSGEDTRIYGKKNKLAAWYYSVGKDGYKLRELGAAEFTDSEINNSTELLADMRFSGVDAKEISEMVIMSHASTFNDFLKKRDTDPLFLPVNIMTIPQLRMTRCIVGEYTQTIDEEHKYFEDSIGMVGNWRERGPVYEVPFRTLYGKKIKNLITAGRTTSSDDELWDIMRVIPCCAVTGQAAGTAAAMCDDFPSLDVKRLQEKLISDGVVLHVKDII